MEWFAPIAGIIRTVAPSIATAIGGPLAGMAVRELSNAVLGKPDATQDEIVAAVQGATPEQLAALKKIDADFQIRMKELGIDLERIAASDRASARDMQAKVNDWLPRSLAVLVTFGFFGVLSWMMLYGMPSSGSEALLLMLGALQSAWTAIIAFYYGSSAGSAAKTDMLAAMGNRNKGA